MQKIIDLIERGNAPDPLVRTGIRQLLAARLKQEGAADFVARRRQQQALMNAMAAAPVALETAAANEQHYELPAAFFERVLGARLKYSACHWPEGVATLEQAEEAMLEMTCARAGLTDGQRVLELGCGWGSLTLWMAQRYPQSVITAVSNSKSQGEFIRARAAGYGLDNVTVITADMNDFQAPARYDRVVSVEMFEHMRNWAELLRRIRSWLTPEGRLFIHIFVHRAYAYLFETEGAANWMGRYFFTGGLMPSADLLPRHQADLVLLDEWHVDGRHYEKTLRAWLHRQDAARSELMPLFEDTYGAADAPRWFQRWRLFFLACAELFGYHHGTEWFVAHYLLAPRATDT
ncbi:MAG: cyclopropane-fatty-acyl-phospholipid synthase family protein [Candidatus Marinimicrobia bacterium]|nr:cyclopropane-fatty-acyl-phospholipid synthase family protein [Candidatus Neomarinimicrobiota bacterium]